MLQRLTLVWMLLLAALVPGAAPLGAQAGAGPARLVREIVPGTLDLNIDDAVVAGGLLFYTRPAVGRHELWRSDLTAAGTFALAENVTMWRRLFSAEPVYAIDGRRVFFLRESGDSGPPLLMVSDGTRAGTRAVSTARATQLGPVIGGTLFFVGADGAGSELWRSDGTAGGTSLVSDLTPGAAGSQTSAMTAAGGALFFVRAAAANGPFELWRSDGTAAGTSLVRGFAQPPRQLTAVGSGGRLFFAVDTIINGSQAAGELWTSDGTNAGTVRLIQNGSVGGPSIGALRAVGGQLFFRVGAGAQPGLWASDGTAQGTRQLSPGGVSEVVDVDGVAYAAAFSAGQGRIVRSDGTPAGTAVVATVNAPSQLTAVGGALFFVAWSDDGPRLFRLAGAGPALAMTQPANNGEGPRLLLPFGGGLAFLSRDPSIGLEWWRSDGTQAGTGPALDSNRRGRPADPVPAGDAGGRLIFGADNRLWASDGTPGGTVPLTPLTSGLINHSADFGERLAIETRINCGRIVCHGGWLTDGTAAGTRLIDNINRLLGAAAGRAYYLTNDNRIVSTDGSGAPREVLLLAKQIELVQTVVELAGKAVFVANDQLWASDGGPATAIAPIVLAGGVGPSLQIMGGRLVIVGNTPGGTIPGRVLWVSDGTPAGTTKLLDEAALNGFIFEQQVVAGPAFYAVLQANQPTDRKLLRVNPATRQTSIVAVANSAGIEHLAALGERLLFASKSGFNTCPEGAACEVWVSDGTPAGTARLLTLRGPVSGMAPIGGRVLFSEQTAGGAALWASDGTAAVRLAELPGGTFRIDRAQAASGALLFTSRARAGEVTLWRSDGTVAGTTPVQGGFFSDEAAGNPGAYGFARAGSSLFFAGDSFAGGAELWAIRDNLLVEPIGLAAGAPGATASISPRVRNDALTATGAALVVTLDPALELVDAGGGVRDANTLRFALADLGYLSGRSLTLQVRVPAAAALGSRFPLTARLEGLPAGDPPADNSASGAVVARPPVFLPLLTRDE